MKKKNPYSRLCIFLLSIVLIYGSIDKKIEPNYLREKIDNIDTEDNILEKPSGGLYISDKNDINLKDLNMSTDISKVRDYNERNKNLDIASKDVKEKPYIEVNSNIPYFDKPKSIKIYKKYSKLDRLNRVGKNECVIGRETMPKKDRESISHVYPTGWKQKKYDFIDNKFLYNRCHLIGFQLASDNDNIYNLITGTRYMNVEGMLPFENAVASYIRSTGHHVKYIVEPYFKGDEKLARGVNIQAWSIEDDNIKFNVFCPNIQPGVEINYKDGSSKLKK